jgi:hypothetical protein
MELALQAAIADEPLRGGTLNPQRSAESCPYRAKVSRGDLTWHFMPG